MASRIIHKFCRSSCSRSRATAFLAVGTAIPTRMARIAVATINSISVKPLCRRAATNLSFLNGYRSMVIDGFIVSYQSIALAIPQVLRSQTPLQGLCWPLNLSLNRNRRLRSTHRNRLHGRVPRSAPSDGQGRLARRLRYECERHHRSLSRDAAGPRRRLGTGSGGDAHIHSEGAGPVGPDHHSGRSAGPGHAADCDEWSAGGDYDSVTSSAASTAPEGVSDFGELVVSLKQYSDTKQ